MKDKANKVSFVEMEPSFMKEMAKGMNVTKKENGGKYEVFNWKSHSNVDDYLDAIQRHLLEFKDGNSTDEETGVSHLALIADNCMMAFYHEEMKKDIIKESLESFEEIEIDLDGYKILLKQNASIVAGDGLDTDGDNEFDKVLINKSNSSNEFDFSKLKNFDGHVYLSGHDAYFKIMDEDKVIESSSGLIYSRFSSVNYLKELFDSTSDNYYVV
jgi:hypothetical protein